MTNAIQAIETVNNIYSTFYKFVMLIKLLIILNNI